MVAKYIAVSLALSSVALAGPVPAKRSFGDGFGGFGGFDGFEGFDGFSGDFGGFGGHHVSFNGWGGFHSLDNFDDFYGDNNFCGFTNVVQSTLVEEKQTEVVCHSIDVSIIQQQLAIIREYVKKIITTQICEVETQTVVFSQFQTGLFGFSDDLRHISGRHIGFDGHIASQIGLIHDSHGELLGHDLGFHGSDIGTNFVYPSGFNWNPSTSPVSVSSAFSAAQAASAAGGAPDALGPAVPPPSSSTSPDDSTSTDTAPPADASAPPADNSTDTTGSTNSTDSAAPPAASDASSSDSSSSNPNPAND